VGGLKNTQGQAASQLHASKYWPSSIQFVVTSIPSSPFDYVRGNNA